MCHRQVATHYVDTNPALYSSQRAIATDDIDLQRAVNRMNLQVATDDANASLLHIDQLRVAAHRIGEDAASAALDIQIATTRAIENHRAAVLDMRIATDALAYLQPLHVAHNQVAAHTAQ